MKVRNVPYPNEHAARVKDPGLFSKFRRKNIAPGIAIIVGKLKSSTKWVTQAYRFSKSKFSADEAKKWLKSHKIKYKSFEAATGKPAGKKKTVKKGKKTKVKKKVTKKTCTKADFVDLMSIATLYQGVITMAKEKKTPIETPTEPELTPRQEILTDLFGKNQIHGGDFTQISKQRIIPSINYFTLLGGRQDAPMFDEVQTKPTETKTPTEGSKEPTDTK